MKLFARLITGLVATAVILSPSRGNSKDRYPVSSAILSCQFDEPWDRNYDGWPDGWQRTIDATYPGYVTTEIREDATAHGNRSLNVNLNGGSAYFHSPVLSVSSLFSYVLSARVKVERVEHARVTVGIEWQTAQGAAVGEPLQVHVPRSAQWHEARVGPVSPTDPRAEQAIVYVKVERGSQIDLRGAVAISDVRVYRLPQVVLRPEQPLGIFHNPSDVAVRCRLTGISTKPKVRFELRSVEGGLIDEEPAKIVELTPIPSSKNDPASPADAATIEYQGEVVWRPKNAGYGFYRVHATLVGERSEGERRSTTLVVLRPMTRPVGGVFGWSLASVTDPLTTDDWARFLTQMGIHWVKFPVWYNASERDLGDELVHFTERLATFGIEVVGVVDRPPEMVDSMTKLAAAASAAEVFSLDPSHWLPSLDPIMTRLSLRIRWWQFGSDRDTSFVGYPNLPSLIRGIRRQLYRFGQNVRVGVPWKWMSELPQYDPAPWEFVQWSADPTLTGAELAANLASPPPKDAHRWVLIDPAPRDTYSLSARVADLIHQMAAAHIGGADAAFLPYPVDSSRGVLDDAGAPDELLLPFRTTATLLADAHYIGSMRLPSGSRNRVFRKPDGLVFMMVWNGGHAAETLFLGEDIQHFDPWGRDIPVGEDGVDQTITVTDLPSFVLGLNEAVATIRIGAAFEQTSMPSIFGRPHPNVLTFTNAFPQGVAGTIKPTSSTAWEFGPDRLTFKAAAGAEVRIPFEIRPLPNASSGRQEVRLDFEIQSARSYTFSVWRTIDVGLGEIDIEISTIFDSDGTLVVEQRTLNHTDQLVDFKCLLYAQDRRRQRNHIYRLGRGQDLQYYRFPNAQDLIGTDLWLRAEEVGGPRVLNYRFRVER